IHRRSGHSDIAICCGRNVRGSSPSTSVVPLSNHTTLNHKRFKGFKMFSDGHLKAGASLRRNSGVFEETPHCEVALAAGFFFSAGGTKAPLIDAEILLRRWESPHDTPIREGARLNLAKG